LFFLTFDKKKKTPHEKKGETKNEPKEVAALTVIVCAEEIKERVTVIYDNRRSITHPYHLS